MLKYRYIFIHVDPKGEEPKEMRKWIVGSPVVYASFVELGTSHMRAQPYLRPAIIKFIPFIANKIVKDIIKFFRVEVI